MICQLRGKIVELNLDKEVLRAVVDVQGVGYEVLMTPASQGRMAAGQMLTLLITESVTAFDGATTLYGFLTREEKDFFGRIRENVDGMGPKKALECLEKISKSMPDFKRAVIDGDLRLLISVFGFTKKTAEKLIFALKGRVEGWSVSGPLKWHEPATSEEGETVSGLLNMGYSEEEARELAAKARTQVGPEAATAALLKEALRLAGTKIS